MYSRNVAPAAPKPVPNYVYSNIVPMTNTNVYGNTGGATVATNNVFNNLVPTPVLTTIPLIDNDELGKTSEEVKTSDSTEISIGEKPQGNIYFYGRGYWAVYYNEKCRGEDEKLVAFLFVVKAHFR